jgi:methylglyoxal synthase
MMTTMIVSSAHTTGDDDVGTQPQKNKVDINTIDPLKAYLDGDLKHIAKLKERYDEPTAITACDASACRVC